MTSFSQLGLIALALTGLGVMSVAPAHAQADFTLTNRVLWGPNGKVSTNIGIPNGGVASGEITVTNAIPGTYNPVYFSVTLNATGPVVSFRPPTVVLAPWTGDVVSTTMSIAVGQNVLHGGFLLNVSATNGGDTHFIVYQLKVYTIAITIDAQSSGSTDQAVESSASEPKTFKVGVLVSNATSIGGTLPECTVSFPCAFAVYGWQFALNYDPTVLLPQGDPNPLATPGNPSGFYVDGAEGTLLLGNQPNIGEGTATWATLFAGGHAFVANYNGAGKIVEAYTLVSPEPPAFLTSTVPNTHYLLGSVSFELLQRPASPTIVTLNPSDIVFVNQLANKACSCVVSTSPGEGGVAVETITNTPPAASFTVTPLPAGNISCIPITGTSCSPYAFILDARASFDPDSNSPLQYFWDFGDGNRDSPAEVAAGCPETSAVLKCSQGALAVHDYRIAGAADNAPMSLRIADTDGTLPCILGNACATGSAVDPSGNPLQNPQPSHASSTSNPFPLSPPSLFTFSPSNPMVGETVLFRINPSIQGNFSGYPQWDFGDGTTEFGFLAFHTYNNSGNYTVVFSMGIMDQAVLQVRAADPTEPRLIWTRESRAIFSVSADGTSVYAVQGWSGYLGVISRYDSNGTLVWTSPTTWFAHGVSVGFDGVYVAESRYVEKFDLNGNRLWAHDYNFSRWANAVSAASDGVYVAGGTDLHRGFVTKFDPNGNELWTLQILQNEFAISVGPKAVYALACCTVSQVPSFEQDAQLVAISFKGKELWSVNVGSFVGVPDFPPFPMAVSPGPDGIYVSEETGRSTITGEDQGLVRKYDFRGREEWTHYFQSEGPSSVSAGSSGVYVSGGTGTCSIQCSDSLQYFFVAYLDSMGNQVWMLRFDTWSWDHISASISSSTNGVFVSVTTLAWGSVSRIAPPDPVVSDAHTSQRPKSSGSA